MLLIKKSTTLPQQTRKRGSQKEKGVTRTLFFSGPFSFFLRRRFFFFFWFGFFLKYLRGTNSAKKKKGLSKILFFEGGVTRTPPSFFPFFTKKGERAFARALLGCNPNLNGVQAFYLFWAPSKKRKGLLLELCFL